MTTTPNSADDLVTDFRERARICRTNADAFDTKAAAIWDMAADAAEKPSPRQPDLVEEYKRLEGCVKACGFESLETAVEHLADEHLRATDQTAPDARLLEELQDPRLRTDNSGAGMYHINPDLFHRILTALSRNDGLLADYWNESRRYIYDKTPERREKVILQFAARIDAALGGKQKDEGDE